MKKDTKPTYPDWNNPQAIIVVADNDNPKRVRWQPYDWNKSDLCKREIQFHTDCDFYSDFFDTKTAEEKKLLDQECGRQLAWSRAMEVAAMLWQKKAAARREYERYAVYFQPAYKDVAFSEAVCICSVLSTTFMGGNNEG